MFFRTSLAALAAVLLSAGGAFAQIELKLGHVAEPGSLIAQSADEFARRANERLAGKAKITVYPSSQLGSDKDMYQKLKLNQLQLWIPSTIMSSVADEFGVFEMPYIIKDRAHMKRVMESSGISILSRPPRRRAYLSSANGRMASVTSRTTCVPS